MNEPHHHLVCAMFCFAIFVGAVLSPSLLLGDDHELRVDDQSPIPLVRIEPGLFSMGCSSRGSLIAAILSLGEQGDWVTEGPVRNVTITKAFRIGKYKVTTEQYCQFLNSIERPIVFVDINRFSNIEKRDGKYHPKKGKERFPANSVHWRGAAKYCEWLSIKTGKKVRLPTEAEWEFTARGAEGRKTPWGEKSVDKWSSIEGSEVDTFPENATPEGVVGMIDYVVGEWCSDFYEVRYNPQDLVDPTGPAKNQLALKSENRWLATAHGIRHVQRGRANGQSWPTTGRDLGEMALGSGIYGFRIVVED